MYKNGRGTLSPAQMEQYTAELRKVSMSHLNHEYRLHQSAISATATTYDTVEYLAARATALHLVDKEIELRLEAL